MSPSLVKLLVILTAWAQSTLAVLQTVASVEECTTALATVTMKRRDLYLYQSLKPKIVGLEKRGETLTVVIPTTQCASTTSTAMTTSAPDVSVITTFSQTSCFNTALAACTSIPNEFACAQRVFAYFAGAVFGSDDLSVQCANINLLRIEAQPLAVIECPGYFPLDFGYETDICNCLSANPTSTLCSVPVTVTVTNTPTSVLATTTASSSTLSLVFSASTPTRSPSLSPIRTAVSSSRTILSSRAIPSSRPVPSSSAIPSTRAILSSSAIPSSRPISSSSASSSPLPKSSSSAVQSRSASSSRIAIPSNSAIYSSSATISSTGTSIISLSSTSTTSSTLSVSTSSTLSSTSTHSTGAVSSGTTVSGSNVPPTTLQGQSLSGSATLSGLPAPSLSRSGSTTGLTTAPAPPITGTTTRLVPITSSGKPVTITLTETYVVPCSTGFQTSTVTMTTTHCGCTETPVPSRIPMTTYRTTCPTSWGFTAPVAVTVPALTGILPVATSPASGGSSLGGESAGSGSGPIPAPTATESTPITEIGGVPGDAQPTAAAIPTSNNPVSSSTPGTALTPATSSQSSGRMQSTPGSATVSATNAVFTGVASKVHTSVAGFWACLGFLVLFYSVLT